jgi:hypothetical protein
MASALILCFPALPENQSLTLAVPGCASQERRFLFDVWSKPSSAPSGSKRKTRRLFPPHSAQDFVLKTIQKKGKAYAEKSCD